MTFEYEGEVYVRPLGRGIHLNDHPDDLYLDDAIAGLLGDAYSMSSGWAGRLRISVTVLEEEAA